MGSDDGETRPSLADSYPTLARGPRATDGSSSASTASASHSCGPGRRRTRLGRWGSLHKTLDEALENLDASLARFLEEEGFNRKRSYDAQASRTVGEKPRKTKATSKKTTHRPEQHPAAKRVQKLDEIAEALGHGESFSVTRLTTLKGLCGDLIAAGAFALFLARKIQKRIGRRRRRYAIVGWSTGPSGK